MEKMSKRSKRLVDVYRKAVEQREALDQSTDLDADGVKSLSGDVVKKALSSDDFDIDRVAKKAKKDKASKKDKGMSKDPKKAESKKSDQKKSDSKKSHKLAEGEKSRKKVKAEIANRKLRVAKTKSSSSISNTDRKDRKISTKVMQGSSSKSAPNAMLRSGSSKTPLFERQSIKQFQERFPYMQNRELSWLEFNKRVLDQGADPTVPLFERLGFISIFWSNLQEFFMIRVGSLTDLALIKKMIIDTKSGMTPSEQLEAVYARCHELYPYYEKCYKDVRAQLTSRGIVNLTQKELNDEQAEYAQEYFSANVMPFLSPQIINARHPFPHLENGGLYIVVRLDEQADPRDDDKASKSGKDGKDGKKKKAKNLGAEGVTLGLIPLPRQCKRIVQLPGDGLQFILLEHMIEMFVPQVFSMYKVKHTNVICVTRNADLDATEGIEEQGEDYREHMKRIIKKRARLAPVRLESERELSQTVKPVLMQRLNLSPEQLFVTSVPLNMSYTFELPSLVDESMRAALTSTPFTPQWPSCLDRNRSIIDQVSEREVLLSYPYETMDAFVQLLREAAADPDVISIKITLYRLAKQSHLAEALIAAADSGKEVTALFELRARFDESNNIEWSQRFDQAGCNVLYGFRDFKVHSKVCCITRQTPEGLQYITQLGTGNYNEKTAKLYTDFSFITSDPRIGLDAVQFFRNMALENTSNDYSTLWVAPLQIKQNILAGIDDQIRKHREGQPSGIFFKTNSITDKEIIEKIVEASQAGVKCNLLVRGISCIVPGVEGYTDNVCVDSIVGRLLEHSRIYCFGPFDGDVDVYLSSADLMTRNMDKRIEIAWPVENEDLRDQIIGYIGTCMADTAKLRDLLPTRQYTPLGFFAETANSSGVVEMFDSQSFLIDEAQRKRLEAVEMAVSGVSHRADIVREIDEVEISAERLSDALGEEVTEYETVVDAVIGATSDEATEEPVDAEGVDSAGVTDVLEAIEVVEVAQAAEAVEAVEIPEAVEITGIDEVVEVAETVEVADVNGATEEAERIDAVAFSVDDAGVVGAANVNDGMTGLDVVDSYDDSDDANVDSSAPTWVSASAPSSASSDEATGIIREPISELQKEVLPRELPMLDGVPTYEVLSMDRADLASQTWEIPNVEAGNSVPLHVGESSYTDPNSKPTPLEMPEEKPSLFKRLFGR